MMQSVVISLWNTPPGQPVSATFGMSGGTIGRASSNTLVLDDPERVVSRVHAQVVYRGGRYLVIDRGSNPTLHNGQELGPGQERPLNDGDRLTIGGFELLVAVVFDEAASADADYDPLAEFLVQPGAPHRAPAAAQAVLEADEPDDPFALPPPYPPPPIPSGSQPAGADSQDQNAADDFSDFATPIGEKAPSIDSLFRTKEDSNAGMRGDPLAGSPLAEPLHQPNTATDADPLAALAGAPTPDPHSDHVPVMQFNFTPPQEVTPESAIESIAAPAPGFPSQPVPAASPAMAVAPVASDAPAPAAEESAVTAPEPKTESDALLAAFLRGLRNLNPPPQRLTPAFMERVGALLRAATEGTLQLLLTRQQFKHELRVERTMIVARGNNPLKFSPTVEVALAHLLGPNVRSFMQSDEAMRDAFNDLRAHQFAVMVGMRAALAELIERFAPGELEKKITERSPLDSLFAAPRKAKLWDQFVRFYASLATEAEDDFHNVFERAFAQAYEEQMARIKSSGPSGRGEPKK